MSSVGAAIAVAGAATAAGGVASAAIGANAAENAAQTQASAAEQAQQLQAQEAQNALNFQESEWNTQQQNEAPFLAAGTQGAKELQSQVSTPGEGLLANYPGGAFTAPTAAQAEAYPGEQFQLQQGAEAIDENAAATGNLQSGTTGKALENYGQGLAQTDYGNLYNQMLNTYMTNYGVWNQGQTNDYNRLAGLAGVGTSAAAGLGAQGAAAANNFSNTSLTAGAQQGQDIQNAAAASASGTIGAANAINGGIGSITSGLSALPLYSLLGQQQQSLNASSYTTPAAANSYQNGPNAAGFTGVF